MSAYSLMQDGPRSVRSNFGLVLLLAGAVLAWSAARSDAATAGMATTNTYGSGKLYKNSVERQSEGDLSAEDLHQASLLTSQQKDHELVITMDLRGGVSHIAGVFPVACGAAFRGTRRE
jgi:hypothetical protein